jgi:TonB family protein
MRRLWMIALSLAVLAIPGHSQQAAQQTDAPVPADQLAAKKINPPSPIKTVEAEFSDEAKRKHIDGVCLVSLIVDAQGNPQNARIIHCTDSSFEESSLDAVKQYRFNPAATQEGKPIPVMIHVEIHYHLDRNNSNSPIRLGFSSPPGMISADPSANGVYPFTKFLTSPSMTRFSDEGYGPAAIAARGKGGCDIVLTINAKGKASDPVVIHCETPALEKPAVDSLLRSKYKPGSVNGKAVAIRASVHLEYNDVPPKP